MDICERCILPDCDDQSGGCNLRRLSNSADYKRRRGRAAEITDEERFALKEYFQIWRLEDKARRSEAQGSA